MEHQQHESAILKPQGADEGRKEGSPQGVQQKGPAREPFSILGSLRTPDFVRSVGKLVVQAILIGVVAPLLIFVYKETNKRAEHDRDIRRIRDAASVAAKKQLFDELTKLIWEYESLALDITF